ncbi:restriction endonuclease subunit S [Brucella pituitosa]|uniref:restriction endonuclease subunit S n=1 Tax=Brucella pituitosa TaxID=571256 RepID=UPI0009A23508|nr:restriction endonuclease subunit S [Brucella pituitosa]
MTNWREFVLGDLVKFKGGSVFPKEAQGVVSGDLPFVKVSDMNRTENWKDLHGAENWLSASAAKTLKAAIHAPGAVAFAKIGIALTYNRRRRIVRPTLLDNNMMSASTISKDLASDFLYHLLQTLDFNTVSAGSALPYLTVGTLNKIPVRLPPPEQQKDISCLLNQLDDKIELNRRMNETLEAMAQAIFRDWFMDFGPTRRKLEGAADPITIMGGLVQDVERAQALADLFPASLSDGLPDGWAVGRLDDVLELAYGKALPKGERKHGSVPVFGSGGIGGFHNKALVSGPSVIVGRKGTVGSLYWEDSSFFPIDTVFYVKSKLPMTYCYYLLQTLGLETMNTDAAVPGLNRNNAYRLDVLVPSDAVITEFGKIASLLRSKITANVKENRTVAATRDLLLPKLMSGEIRLDATGETIE